MNKTITFIVLIILLSGCSNAANANKDVESKLNQAYEDLYLSMYGLEYPPNQKVLETCRKNKIEPCLRVYGKVKDAEKMLQNVMDQDESLALRITLNKVGKCNDEKSGDDFTCAGAVVSLYFFNKEKHQQQIMEALNRSNNDVKKLSFYHKHAWFLTDLIQINGELTATKLDKK